MHGFVSQAKNPLQKRVLLSLPRPQEELCHVLRFLLRPGGRHLPVCLLLPLHLHSPSALPGQPPEEEHGLLLQGTAGAQRGEYQARFPAGFIVDV